MGRPDVPLGRLVAAVTAVAAGPEAPAVVLGAGPAAERIRRALRATGRPTRTAADVGAASALVAASPGAVVVVTAPYLAAPLSGSDVRDGSGAGGLAPDDVTAGFGKAVDGAGALVVDLTPDWTGTSWAGRDWIDVVAAAAGAGWTATGDGDRVASLWVTLVRDDGPAAEPAVVAAYEQRLADLAADAGRARAELATQRHQVMRSTDRVIGVEAELTTLRHGVTTDVADLTAEVTALRARITELLGSRSWRVGQALLNPARRLRG